MVPTTLGRPIVLRAQAAAEFVAAAERRILVSLPVRVEDRRQQGWLVDIPDLDLEEIAGLIRACPQARFVVPASAGAAPAIISFAAWRCSDR